MTDQDFDTALQAIATSINQIVARLESPPSGARENADNRDALLIALKCGVELTQLRQNVTHRRLVLMEKPEPSPLSTDVGKLREDLDERFVQLSAYFDDRLAQLEASVATQAHHGIGLHNDLRQRIDALEQQLLSRRFSEDLRAKFEKHYPEHRWADTVAQFDRWIMTEKTRQDGPTGAFRRFIKVWLGESRPRWVIDGAKDEPQDTTPPQ